jgi:hypothetical protein
LTTPARCLVLRSFMAWTRSATCRRRYSCNTCATSY